MGKQSKNKTSVIKKSQNQKIKRKVQQKKYDPAIIADALNDIEK